MDGRQVDMRNVGSADFEGQKIQLGKNPGRESL